MPDRLRYSIIVVVAVIWVCNFIAGLIPPLGYDPSESINGIFMGVVGGALALGAKKEKTSD